MSSSSRHVGLTLNREREEEKMESGTFKTVQQLAKLFPHQNTEEHANVSEEGHSSRAAGSRACEDRWCQRGHSDF